MSCFTILDPTLAASAIQSLVLIGLVVALPLLRRTLAART